MGGFFLFLFVFVCSRYFLCFCPLLTMSAESPSLRLSTAPASVAAPSSRSPATTALQPRARRPSLDSLRLCWVCCPAPAGPSGCPSSSAWRCVALRDVHACLFIFYLYCIRVTLFASTVGRNADAQNALPLLLTGQRITADKAKRLKVPPSPLTALTSLLPILNLSSRMTVPLAHPTAC